MGWILIIFVVIFLLGIGVMVMGQAIDNCPRTWRASGFMQIFVVALAGIFDIGVVIACFYIIISFARG